MNQIPSPKLDPSLLRGDKRAWVTRRGTIGCLGLALTLFFGLVYVPPFFSLDFSGDHGVIYAEEAGFRIKSYTIPTVEDLETDNASTPDEIRRYLKNRESSSPERQKALDQDYEAMMLREDLSPPHTKADLMTMHGETCLKRGDREAAISLFEEARRMAPENPWPLVKLIRAKSPRLQELLAKKPWTAEERNEFETLYYSLEELEAELVRVGVQRIVALSWLRSLGFDPLPPDPMSRTDSRDAALVADLWRWAIQRPALVRAAEIISTRTAVASVDRWDRGSLIEELSYGGASDSTAHASRRFMVITAAEETPAWAVDGRPATTLRFTRADTLRISAALNGFGFRTVVATGDREGLVQEMLKEVMHSTEETELIVYYSGHGFTDTSGKTVIGTDDPRSVLTLTEMRSVLSHHRGEVTILLDACRDQRDVYVDVGDVEQLIGPNPPNVLMGTGTGALAIESETLGASVFTTAVERHLEQVLLHRCAAPHHLTCDLQADCVVAMGDKGVAGVNDCDNNSDGASKLSAARTPCWSTGLVGGDFDGDIETWHNGSTHTYDVMGRKVVLGCTFSVAQDLVTAFDTISEETTELARDLHGVDQVPVLMTGGDAMH